MKTHAGGHEDEASRGMQEVLAKKQAEHGDEVSEVEEHAGAQLLSEFVRSMNIQLRPDEMQVYLELLLSNTEFQGSSVVYRGVTKPNTFQTFPAYSYKMQEMYGEYPGNAYNIWFQRSEGKWILNYSKVPKQGNYRG